MQARPRCILPIIIASQFAGTSLWFAGNAVLSDLQSQWGLAPQSLGYVTSAVQLGFIAGTLTFAFYAIADVFSPRLIFFTCSILGAIANALIVVPNGHLAFLLGLRFTTGFFLAGIYPVGMKIAAGWFQRDLGNALGFLLGALVLGTAFPHLLKALGGQLPWELVALTVSSIAAVGGLLMLVFVPDGPFLGRKARFDPHAIVSIFRSPGFRASSFGYFGHMWELYAFWAFVPGVIAARLGQAGPTVVSAWSFAVIAAGSLGCVIGGLISLRLGSAPVAFAQLALSGLCCVLSPIAFHAPTPLFIIFLLIWGIAVVGDSPQFSALNASNAPNGLIGSALTFANCIGFTISIISIQLLNAAAPVIDPAWLLVALALGPFFGLLALSPLLRPASGK